MRALLVVDLQNDFMPFGSLPVAQGDETVPFANRLMPVFDVVVATQDWHPPDSVSFASNHAGHDPGDVVEVGGIEQILWPDHCVRSTPGASFHSGLDIVPIDLVIHKGVDPMIDSYSAFFDNRHQRSTGLAHELRKRGVDDVAVMGLATDYCVLYSTRDALGLGFRVSVVVDGCRAVEVEPGDGERAVEEMRARGARIVTAYEIEAEELVRQGR